MDSEYLKKNVLPALTEALGAMSTQVPEDQVEFVGRYLLSYVDRKEAQQIREREISDVEVKVAAQKKIDEEKEKALAEKLAPEQHIATQYKRVLDGIILKGNKEEAIDSVVTFLETTMNIPAAYYAVKLPSGETEYLKYMHAGPNSKSLIGKKLFKPSAEEGAEDAPERQGVSFEAFKVPEVPEEEAPPEEEGAEPKQKGPPPLVNLIVPNAMRDKRVKFFGIPKLGSYVVCPFKYASLDHDGAVRFNPGEGAEVQPSYELVKADYSFMIAFDSVGNYRLFNDAEIERVSTLGSELIKLFEKLETKAGEKQMEFINGPAFKKINDTVNEIAAKIAEEEAAAVAAVQPAEGTEPPPAEIAEFVKGQKDSAAAVSAWSKAVGGGSLAAQWNVLSYYLLPLASPAVKLLFAVASLLNYDVSSLQDVAGDLNWDLFKKNVLPTIAGKIAGFQANSSTPLLSKNNSIAAVKAYLEANNLSDASIYPSFFPLFGSLVLPWLTKAIAAREAAIAYSTEVDKTQLETFAE